ncbi:MAG TPA: RT0821/Lpp0805 family surface protein [Kofleriaceae bacterium]|nr:RT0821/Lpp0805 family surface protein [Kofleriaceae bacterium]
MTAVLVLVVGALAGCATKRQTGAATGAVAGGALGAAVGDETGLLIGAALGGLLGHEIGRSIEEEDRRRMGRALELNRPARWHNPDTGTRYELEPTDSFERAGLPCREFRMEAEVGRDVEEVYGTACRQPDGSWEIAT